MLDDRLAAFLLARIGEEGDRANALAALSPSLAEQIRQHVAVKRRAVELASAVLDRLPYWEYDDAQVLAWTSLRLLAGEYADHPDFDMAEWVA